MHTSRANDSVFGGSGDHAFIVANQGDFLGYDYFGGSGTDTLDLAPGVTIPGGGAGLSSIEDTLYRRSLKSDLCTGTSPLPLPATQ